MNSIEQEFTNVVREHKGTIYTVCYMFSKDEDEVADLFQEILINIWKGFEKFSQELYNRHHKPKEKKVNYSGKKKKEPYKPREKKANKVNKIQNDTVDFSTNDVRKEKWSIFFDDQKPKKHSGKCDGDCKNCPPHYGYRYGRWYYGHSHSEGCEFGGNKCDGGRD